MSEPMARYRCQHCWRKVRRAAYFGTAPRFWCARCQAAQPHRRLPARLWPPPPRSTLGDTGEMTMSDMVLGILLVLGLLLLMTIVVHGAV